MKEIKVDIQRLSNLWVVVCPFCGIRNKGFYKKVVIPARTCTHFMGLTGSGQAIFRKDE